MQLLDNMTTICYKKIMSYLADIKKECRYMDLAAEREEVVRSHILYMLDRTQEMFDYEGLPDSIPRRKLEMYLQTYGFVVIPKGTPDLTAFFCNFGGEPDIYYRPTQAIIANPRLKKSIIADIGKDCEVVLNDSYLQGLLPMFKRYASALVDNELSMKLVTINSRISSVITAADDNDKQSADKYLEDIASGKLGVIVTKAFSSQIGVQPYASSSYSDTLKNLIEHEQYLWGKWYNDIGLQSPYNMKREALNSSEVGMNMPSMLPLVQDMLRCRQTGFDRVNKMFGTNITVKFGKLWQYMNDVASDAEAYTDNTEGEGNE